MRPIHTACLLLTSLAPLATQQTPLLIQDGATYLTRTNRHRDFLAAGDLDGDGHADVLVGDFWGRATALLGDGSGRFRAGPESSTNHLNARPDLAVARLGDADGDGDLDLFLFGEFYLLKVLEVLENDGTGRFHNPVRLGSWMLSDPHLLELGDFDGDGDLDVVRAGTDLDIYRNDGPTQGFVLAHSRIGRFQALHVADGDGDGDDDVFFDGATDEGWLFDDGAGGYREQLLGLSAVGTIVALADFDGDGIDDLVFAFRNNPPTVLLGVAGGGYVDVGVRGLGALPEPHDTLDLDLDGDLDLVSGDATWLNDGAGHFVSSSALSPIVAERPDSARRVWLDFDGDRYPDMVQDVRGLVPVFNAGGRELVHVPAAAPLERVLFLAELDGDDVPDLLWFGRFWRGDGFGDFVEDTSSHPFGVDDRCRPVDIDQDGDVDLFVEPYAGTANFLAINDGSGRFQRRAAPGLEGTTRMPVFVDLDGDGDLDVLFSGPQLAAFENRSGTFAPITGQPATSAVARVEAADCDGDGDLDVLLDLIGQQVLALNDGSGVFSLAPAGAYPPLATGRSTVAAHWVDFDLDGDPDVIEEVRGAGWEGPRLLSNNGRGRFVNTTANHWPTAQLDNIEVTDVDSDGDPDLLGGDARAAHLFLNDGQGNFHVAALEHLIPSLAGTDGLHSADLDADGDLDRLSSGKVLWGTRRQLHAASLPRLGRSYELDLYDRGAGTSRLAAWWLGPLLSTPVDLAPYGRVRVDPTVSVFGPTISFGAQDEVRRQTIGVPTDPALLGAAFGVQAVVVDAAGAAAVTNALRGSVVR